MKLNKQSVIRALCAHTLICSVLSLIFSGKKKTLSSIFAGLSIAGAVANLIVVFSDKLPSCKKCLKGVELAEECEDECDDEEYIDESDIFCDFENNEEETEEATEESSEDAE